MAAISKTDNKLVITLSTTEKIETVRAGFEVPLDSIQTVEIIDAPIKEVHGLKPRYAKLYGLYVPGESAVGVFLNGGLKVKPAFIAVHHNEKQAIQINLEGTKYSKLLIGSDDPAAIIQLLK